MQRVIGEALELTFHITSNCNLRCSYCYQQHSDKKEVMLAEDGIALVDILIAQYQHSPNILSKYLSDSFDAVTLRFFGGEASLYIDVIDEICSHYFKRVLESKLYPLMQRSVILIESNGTTFFTESVQKFISKFKDKLQFCISTDGCKECFDRCRRTIAGESVFDTVNDAILKYKEMFGEPPKTKLTISKDNVDCLFETHKYFYNTLGYTTFYESVDINEPFTEEFSKQYESEMRKTIDWIIDNNLDVKINTLKTPYNETHRFSSCGIEAGMGITMDWKRNLYICQRWCESSCGDRALPIGTLSEGITNQKLLSDILSRNNEIYSPECKHCKIASGCDECPAENYIFNGDVKKIKRNCTQTNIDYQLQKYYLSRLKVSKHV